MGFVQYAPCCPSVRLHGPLLTPSCALCVAALQNGTALLQRQALQLMRWLLHGSYTVPGASPPREILSALDSQPVIEAVVGAALEEHRCAASVDGALSEAGGHGSTDAFGARRGLDADASGGGGGRLLPDVQQLLSFGETGARTSESRLMPGHTFLMSRYGRCAPPGRRSAAQLTALLDAWGAPARCAPGS